MSFLPTKLPENVVINQPEALRPYKNTAVFEFLTQNQCILDKTKKNRPQSSHYSMVGQEGGQYYVDADKNKIFLQKLAQDLERNQQHFLIERKTPVFRLFFDFDIQTDSVWDDDIILRIMQFLRRSVRSCYKEEIPEYYFQMLIIKAKTTLIPLSSKKKEEDRPYYYKIGIHPVFPFLFVDKAIALSIRKYVLDCFVTKFSRTLKTRNTWDDIIDECVFLNNGLRLPGTYKPQDCPTCSGSNNEDIFNCQTCYNRKKVALNRIYYPWKIIVDDYNHDSCENWSWIRVLEYGSIRVFDQECTPGLTQEIQNNLVSVEEDPKRNRKKRNTHNDHGGDLPASSSLHDSHMPLSPSDQRFEMIQEFINTRTIPEYSDLVIKRILRSHPKVTNYIINVEGKNSRFCLNKGGPHKSVYIWFIITAKNECQQRCYCKCNTRRLFHVPCKKFYSNPFPLPDGLFNILFPDRQRIIPFNYDYTNDKQFLYSSLIRQLKEMNMFLSCEILQYEEEQKAEKDRSDNIQTHQINPDNPDNPDGSDDPNNRLAISFETIPTNNRRGRKRKRLLE